MFVENQITEQTVLSLTTENLETLGETVPGDKHTILTHVKSILPAAPDSSVASTLPVASAVPASTFKLPAASVKLPCDNANITHPQYHKFITDWNVCKCMTSLLVQQIPSHVYSACDKTVQNSIVNSHHNFLDMDKTTMLKAIK